MERTKLHRFMEREGVSDTDLSYDSGVSLRQISYIKLGEKEPTRPRMTAILWACRRLTGKTVDITELFDFSAPRRVGRAAA